MTTSRILSAVPWGKMGRRPFLNVKSAEASRNKITYCRGSPSHDARQSFYRDKGSLLVQLVCCTARQYAFVWSSASETVKQYVHTYVRTAYVFYVCSARRKLKLLVFGKSENDGGICRFPGKLTPTRPTIRFPRIPRLRHCELARPS